MDQILASNQKFITIDTEKPKQTRFYINQGMNYVYEHEVEPYNKLLLRLTIRDGKLIVEKKSLLGIVADVVDIEARTLGDMVYCLAMSPDKYSFDFPNVIISDEEREFFDSWMKLNNLSGNEKKLWRERI